MFLRGECLIDPHGLKYRQICTGSLIHGSLMQTQPSQGLYKGVTTAYLILILHVLLIAVTGLLVIFFGSLVRYAIWIFLGFSAVLALSAFIFYRRLKRQGKQLKDTLNTSAFKGKNVEVSFLGGLASFRVGDNGRPPAIETDRIDPVRQLEDPETMRIRQLSELARLYEDNLITTEEFNTLKGRIVNE